MLQAGEICRTRSGDPACRDIWQARSELLGKAEQAAAYMGLNQGYASTPRWKHAQRPQVRSRQRYGGGPQIRLHPSSGPIYGDPNSGSTRSPAAAQQCPPYVSYEVCQTMRMTQGATGRAEQIVKDYRSNLPPAKAIGDCSSMDMSPFCMAQRDNERIFALESDIAAGKSLARECSDGNSNACYRFEEWKAEMNRKSQANEAYIGMMDGFNRSNDIRNSVNEQNQAIRDSNYASQQRQNAQTYFDYAESALARGDHAAAQHWQGEANAALEAGRGK